MKRYLVLAFYEHLGIHCRVVDFSNQHEAYDYINGLRMCETPYLAKDWKTGKVFDRCNYGMTPDRMAELFSMDYDENGKRRY